MELRDGKLWIHTDNTEDGIATELVADEVAKDRRVRDYYSSPVVREMGEFEVARETEFSRQFPIPPSS